MPKSLRIYINPQWTIYGYEDYIEMPDGFEDWDPKDQQDFVEEELACQIEDRGFDIVNLDDGSNETTELEPESDTIQDLLQLVGTVRTIEQIESWSPEDRTAVIKWASAVHLDASDNDVEIPPKPACLSD